jgi:hypothetical protein
MPAFQQETASKATSQPEISGSLSYRPSRMWAAIVLSILTGIVGVLLALAIKRGP